MRRQPCAERREKLGVVSQLPRPAPAGVHSWLNVQGPPREAKLLGLRPAQTHGDLSQ